MKTDRKLYEAIAKRNKEKTKSFAFRFNIDTQKDIIDYLNSKPNKAGYIAYLIRKDMNNGDYEEEKPLTLSQLAKEEIKDEDEIVLIYPDDSVLRTTREKILNDNKIVISSEILQTFESRRFIIHVRYA